MASIIWGVVVAWELKQRLQSEGKGMTRDHLWDSGIKRHPPNNNTAWPITNWFPDVYVCMCVHNHWAPGRVAFRLKAAPVKIRILCPLFHTSSASAHVRFHESNYQHALLHWEVCAITLCLCILFGVYCLVYRFRWRLLKVLPWSQRMACLSSMNCASNGSRNANIVFTIRI